MAMSASTGLMLSVALLFAAQPAATSLSVHLYPLTPFSQPSVQPSSRKAEASELAPMFPFVADYNMNLQTNTGGATRGGFLNVPIPGWGIWDFKGNLDNGPTTNNWGYGFMVHPVNPLKLNYASTQELLSDPEFAAARGLSYGTDPIPVLQLPSGQHPLTCKPPFCNPFVQSVSSDFLRGSGASTLEGGLDFPIPAGPNGLGVRFPLSGGISSGGPPANVNYGHHLGPIDPLLADQRRLQRERERARKELLNKWEQEQTQVNRLVQQLQQQQQPPAATVKTSLIDTLPAIPDLPDFATMFAA